MITEMLHQQGLGLCKIGPMKDDAVIESHRTSLVEEHLEQGFILAFTNVDLGEEVLHSGRLIAGGQELSGDFAGLART